MTAHWPRKLESYWLIRCMMKRTDHFYAVKYKMQCHLKKHMYIPPPPKKRKKKTTACKLSAELHYEWFNSMFAMGWRQSSRIVHQLYSQTRIRQTSYIAMVIKRGSTKYINVTNPGTRLLGTWFHQSYNGNAIFFHKSSLLSVIDQTN